MWIKPCTLCGHPLRIVNPLHLLRFVMYFCESCNGTKDAAALMEKMKYWDRIGLNRAQKMNMLKVQGYHTELKQRGLISHTTRTIPKKLITEDGHGKNKKIQF